MAHSRCQQVKKATSMASPGLIFRIAGGRGVLTRINS